MSKKLAVQEYVNSIQNKAIKNITQENICNYMQEIDYKINNIESIRNLSNGYQKKVINSRNEILEQLINEISQKQELLVQEYLNKQIDILPFLYNSYYNILF